MPTILIAGPNFGTGSSREHAVWAIQQYGFDAVISPRFGPIFANNATKNGLVPVEVTAEVGRTLMEAVLADPTLEITIDVERRTRRGARHRPRGRVPARRRRSSTGFLEGLDDIGITLRHGDDIDAFESAATGLDAHLGLSCGPVSSPRGRPPYTRAP